MAHDLTDERRWQLLMELTAIEQELARRSLMGFTQYTMPKFEENWHHRRMAAVLDDVLAGKVRRAMFFMPPQNGKSELISRRFPAYALGKNPDLQVISCSYNSDLAKEMSRDVQAIIDSPRYRQVFPSTRLATSADAEVRMAAQFDIVKHEGSYRSAGVGGGITGKPMNIGIIDDPIKSRAEAESETYRRMVWNWYVGDFSSRQTTDETAIILVQTRWHEDDLAGRLLKLARENPGADQWTVVSFPARAEEVRSDDPRQIGDPLWPKRFSKTWLDAREIGMGVYDWASLMQQRPVPPGGAMAKREWFKLMPRLPAGTVVRRCRCWDLAGTVPTPGRDPDWTVGTLLAQLANGYWVVEHVIRVRRQSGEVDQLIKQTAIADGTRTLIREWQDPGAAGKAVINAHRQLLAGWDYEPLPSSGEKSLRWRPFLVQAEGGWVCLLEAPWNREWLDELVMVPFGLHDDQADSVCGAFQALTEFKDLGSAAAAILPDTQTASGPASGDWQKQYYK